MDLISLIADRRHTCPPPATDWKRPPGRPRRTQQVEEGMGHGVSI